MPLTLAFDEGNDGICAISRAEWGRSRPSPKYKRMAFLLLRPELPQPSGDALQIIRSGWFGLSAVDHPVGEF